ncbi:response regulator transcription factor [Robbsia sp. KACC 23696]|uniref:helix-turn-helix transcriptional regulator n=1 Tax=Robbsia sp. KACC 23696 TaxID=3149231 RepID=UPI00325C2FDF
MKFLVVSQNAQEREEMKTLLRQLDRRAQTSDVRDWLQARRALSHEPRDLLLCDLGSTASQTEALRLIDEHRGTLLLAGTCRDMPPQQILDLMRGGVKAVMLQSMGVRAMLRALELVLLGTHYIPPSAISLQSADVASQEVAERRLPYRRRGFGDTPLLSPRQQQIMRLVHMGSTNKGIARALGISEGTVKIHLATVFKTLGASNRAAAVAIYNGWLFEQLDGSRNGAATPPLARVIPLGDGLSATDRLVAPIRRPLLAPPSGPVPGPGQGAPPGVPPRPPQAPTRPPSPGSLHGPATHLAPDAPRLPGRDDGSPARRSDAGATEPPCSPFPPALPDGSGADSGPTGYHRFQPPTW